MINKKRIKLILFLILIIGLSFSQFNKGSKSIAGSINWTRLFINNINIGDLIIASPQYSSFIKSNLSVNITLNNIIYRAKDETDNYDTKELGFGLKYYFNIKSILDIPMYIGAAHLNEFKQDNNQSILLDCGILIKSNENIYFDFGFDYCKDIREFSGFIKYMGISIGVVNFIF